MNISAGLARSPVWLLAVVAVTWGLTLPRGVRAQGPTVAVYPDSIMVAHGSTFTLDIVVSADMTGLMGYDISVTFDGSVIHLQDATEGSLPATSGYETFFRWLNPPPPADSVHVNGAILGNTVDGPGALFTLEFIGYAPSTIGTTDVIIAVSTIRDGVNQDIVHTVAHGWVQVSAPIATESVTWGAVKSLYGVQSP
jgi:hypothetical protein